MSRQNRRKAGISLVELLVAIAMLSILMVSIFDILPRIKYYVAMTQEYRQAADIADNQMELLLMADLEDFVEQGPQPVIEQAGALTELPAGVGMFEVKISEEENLYSVRVDVVWGPPERAHWYWLQTLVQE